ncbi:MAG: 50S ribosomal protein L32 [Candidatus Peregrinibacteria bacterium]|nr:50S ribosomal protein L32 [Candidatus Peregrinibacteria bacterium]MDZ4244829.1 50S ribosomal protein L32 [Candidatus Gracilibacteria bacterium]
MAKHPVPKRKTSKTRTKKRYASFKTRNITRMLNAVQLTVCEKCGEKRRAHHLCEACGVYRGRQVLKVKSVDDKITKIQA